MLKKIIPTILHTNILGDEFTVQCVSFWREFFLTRNRQREPTTNLPNATPCRRYPFQRNGREENKLFSRALKLPPKGPQGGRHQKVRARPPQRHRCGVYFEAAAAPAGDGPPRGRVRIPCGGLLRIVNMCLWTTGVYTRSGD